MLSDQVPELTILIVEDEFLIASDLQRILEKAGYQVIGLASSTTEARSLVLKQAPTIVLLDIFLKGSETGIQLAQWLGALDIPFVYLSANLTDSVLEEAKITQPFGILNKPFQEKDVLTTLEIARYRHAHSAEAKLRRQQEMQMAVNNAIITIQDREELCLAIATELAKLVSFCLLSLRIDLPDETGYYRIMLKPVASGGFVRLSLPALLCGEAADELLAELGAKVPDNVGEQPGIFQQQAFEQLCASSRMAQTLRDKRGVRALALFAVRLKSQSLVSIQLASHDPAGLTPKDYETVSLLMPQIALALTNLLASEETEARRRQKTAELAVVSAFQNGRNMAEVIPQVALAIQELMPVDLLSLFRVGRILGSASLDATVQKQESHFLPLTEEEVALAAPAPLPDWQQLIAAMEPWLLEPTLNVGTQADEARERNAVTKRYCDLLGLRSSLYVPIIIKGEAAAAIIVASKVAFAYTTKDLAALQDLSRQMALALENLLAFERIKTLSEHLEQERIYLKEEIKTTHNFEKIIGRSPALLTVFNHITQVAPTDYTVLVMGETGTGKELIARAIHSLSQRKDRTMIKVNCAALPPQLIESELFGHERGSYTGATDKRIGKFELAHGSTLFLDEIGELPLELQAKLLRAIQEKEIERIGGQTTLVVDVRIVAATNRNLYQEVAAGRFRSDLYYRLNVFPITVPALRERPEDILPLAMHFLQKASKKLGKLLTSLANSSLQQLQQYTWPGNIRELEHVLDRAAILAQTSTVELAEPLLAASAPSTTLKNQGAVAIPKETRPMQETMREAILTALAQSNNRIRGQDGAAALLQIKPTTLEARMKKLAIYLHTEVKGA